MIFRGHNTGIEAPSRMKGDVHHAYNVTRDCLRSRNLPYNNTSKNSLIIINPVNGTRRIGREWVMNYNGFEIGGLFWGTCRGRTFRISIPVNPNTGGEWSMDVLRHEFGHAHDYGASCWGRHPPQLAPCYPRWRDIPGFFIIDVAHADLHLDEDRELLISEIRYEYEDGTSVYITIFTEVSEIDTLNKVNDLDEEFFNQLRNDFLK